MNHENKFSVSRFRNRNGVFSFRVDGRLNDVRIRRNFKTLEEAATEKAALELKSLQIGSNLQAVTTCLSEEQVREAEAAFRRLAGNDRSLAFYLDFALANYREPLRHKSLGPGCFICSPIVPTECLATELQGRPHWSPFSASHDAKTYCVSKKKIIRGTPEPTSSLLTQAPDFNEPFCEVWMQTRRDARGL
jgi:hypothetical protein